MLGLNDGMNPSRIKSAVASVMCVSVADIESRKRTKSVALARHIAMYLTYHDGRTFMGVAKIFGRHHAAVINSVKQVSHWLEHDWEIKDIMKKVKEAHEPTIN